MDDRTGAVSLLVARVEELQYELRKFTSEPRARLDAAFQHVGVDPIGSAHAGNWRKV